MYILVSFTFILYFLFKFVKYKFTKHRVCPERKAVVVTGCSTGFGNLLVKRLDSMGFRVFATSRNPSSPNVLQLKKECSPLLHVLQLDVRSEDSVREALQYVKEHLNSAVLWCLVNNAGIYDGYAVEMTDMNIYHDVMDVNTLGSIRVTKAFLPMLRRSRGRIVYITSPMGRVPHPFSSPYCMSKFALEGFHRCLRIELSMWGVQVIAVEPEHFRTEILDPASFAQTMRNTVDNMDEQTRKEFGEKFISSYWKYIKISKISSSPRLDLVIDDLVSAVGDVRPSDTYRTRRNLFYRLAYFSVSIMSDRLWQKTIALYFHLIRFPTPDSATQRVEESK